MYIMYKGKTHERFNTNTEGKNLNHQKEAQTKLMKGILDLVVLQLIRTEPMHGYQIITKIRRSFGVYFGPSTVYPLLNTLEKKGFINSEWDMSNERPRKVYKLTSNGQSLLAITEDSLNLICRQITTKNPDLTIETNNHAPIKTYF